MLPANPVPIGPSARDAEIQQQQWDDRMRLGEEWGEAGISGSVTDKVSFPHLFRPTTALTHDKKSSPIPFCQHCSLCGCSSKSQRRSRRRRLSTLDSDLDSRPLTPSMSQVVHHSKRCMHGWERRGKGTSRPFLHFCNCRPALALR